MAKKKKTSKKPTPDQVAVALNILHNTAAGEQLFEMSEDILKRALED